MKKSSLYRWGLFALALACTLVFVPLALGAPKANNYLDPGFGPSGKVTTTFSIKDDINPADVVALPDDKLMVVGRFGQDSFLARLTPDGALDPSFGDAGRIVHPSQATGGYPYRLLLQTDGKLIVLTGSDSIVVSRFNADGSVDTSFGVNGLFFVVYGRLTDVTLQPDNKLVMAAYSSSDGGLLVRLTVDGALDSTFGDGGRVVGLKDTFTAVAVSPQGQIYTTLPSASNVVLRRYDAHGQLDTSFGDAGAGRLDVGVGLTAGEGRIKIQPDGKIVTFNNGGGMGLVLARFTSNGSADTTFSDDGYNVTDMVGTYYSLVRGLTLQADGKILAAASIAADNGGFAVARFKTNGDIESAFATDGKYTASDHNLVGLALQSNGRIVAVGGYRFSIYLLGLTDTGAPDRTFGGSDGLGQALVSFLSQQVGQPYALLVQPDGKIVATGVANLSGVLARYNADGTPDSSFGLAGTVAMDEVYIYGMSAAADNKILVVGSSFSQGTLDFMVARLNSDGTLDTTFGSGGQVVFNNYAEDRNYQSDTLLDVVVQPDGKVVAVGNEGYSCGAGCYNKLLTLVRLNADGSFDASFGSNGKVVTSGVANAIALQPDGKIVLAGTTRAYTHTTPGVFMVLRYNLDGTLDPTFGVGGGVSPLTMESQAWDITVLPDGSIVAAGTAITTSAGPVVVARYNPDGTFDTTFDSDGVAFTTAIGWSGSPTHNLAVQPDGKVLVGGTVKQPGSADSFDAALLRITTSGSIDTTFGEAGIVSADFGGSETSNAIALQFDNKIAMAVGRTGFTIARFLNPEPVATPTIGPGCIFSDVCGSEYFFTPVQYLVNHGAISGYGDNTFRPFNEATRGQLAKIIVSAEGWAINTSGGPHFNDVPTENTFYSFIETAYHKGIISGYEDGTFRPYASVTRGQIAKIMVSAEGWAIVTPTAPHFSDVTATNTFYGVIETAYSRGIISGYADGAFKPYSNATRGQIAKIVYAAVTAPTK